MPFANLLRPSAFALAACLGTISACNKTDQTKQGEFHARKSNSDPISNATVYTVATCPEDIGEPTAKKLVERCTKVSPDTSAICNASNSCAMIEAQIARSCSLRMPDDRLKAGCWPDPRSGAAAQAAIKRFYSALNARDYPTAWGSWGPHASLTTTYPEFVQTHTQVKRYTVITGTPSPLEGAAGAVYITVPALVEAQMQNGSKVTFTGFYKLRQRNIENPRGWHLSVANLEED